VTEASSPDWSARIDAVYRADSRRVLATLIRLLGDFELAEEALHDAFHAALEQWPRDGEPKNPFAWLVSTGRFRAIDQLRRRARFDAQLGELAARIDSSRREHEDAERLEASDDTGDDMIFPDDRLRLVFTCCHPALSSDARVALTLRELCGLTTEEIAHAFLTSAPTIAQRIVRAKQKIRESRIPYQIPAADELAPRLDSVLQVIYLVFNEGYNASSGDALTRHALSAESIGLLGLMLLHESRRAARTTADGELVLLDDQDRSRWDRALIVEGSAMIERALRAGPVGQYAIQGAIAAVHADAPTAADTDWAEIVRLYDLLLGADPAPVIELNRAVAIAMRDGPAAGVALIDDLFARGALGDYQFAHSARAELCRRLGRMEEARDGYRRALEIAEQGPERRFLERRLKVVG
jgi:RNA polymerase sigma-70 factor (ECF subfamily)